jgi:glycosyltransferase involved in cell wall biosynthesis
LRTISQEKLITPLESGPFSVFRSGIRISTSIDKIWLFGFKREEITNKAVLNLISIIISTFNRHRVLPAAIKSVLAQSVENWELIIVDDGSTDGTREVLTSFLNHERIHYYYQTNHGVSSARNYGATVAKGDYLIFLDSDDQFQPELLKNLVAINYIKYDLIFWNLLKQYSDHSRIWKPENLGSLYNNLKGTFLAGSVCYRKDLFFNSGAYDEQMSFGENYELAMRISRSGNLNTAHIDKDLIIQHINLDERISNSYDNRLASYQHLYQKHYHEFRKYPKEDSKMNYFLGYVLEKKGQQKEAQTKYRKSWCSYPLNLKPLARLVYLNVWK